MIGQQLPRVEPSLHLQVEVDQATASQNGRSGKGRFIFGLFSFMLIAVAAWGTLQRDSDEDMDVLGALVGAWGTPQRDSTSKHSHHLAVRTGPVSLAPGGFLRLADADTDRSGKTRPQTRTRTVTRSAHGARHGSTGSGLKRFPAAKVSSRNSVAVRMSSKDDPSRADDDNAPYRFGPFDVPIPHGSEDSDLPPPQSPEVGSDPPFRSGPFDLPMPNLPDSDLPTPESDGSELPTPESDGSDLPIPESDGTDLPTAESTMSTIAMTALDPDMESDRLAIELDNMNGEDREKLEKIKNDVLLKAKSLPGVTAPLGFFDPLGFCSDCSEGKLCFYREVELKHGRVAMLATVGIVVGEQLHPLFGGNIDVPAYIAFQQTPLATFWPAVVAAVAIPEIFSVFTFNPPDFNEKVDPKDSSLWTVKTARVGGDLGFDPLGMKPPGPFLTDMQNKELNNGRLAMIAAAGMIAQELATGEKIF